MAEDASHRLAELNEFANTLNAEESLGATMQAVADFSLRVLGCRHVTVLTDAEGQETAAVAGEPGPALVMVPVTAGRFAVAARLAKGGTHVAASLADILLLEPVTPAECMGQAVYRILQMEAGMLGIIVATGPPRGVFAEESVEVMNYLASTASVALHNQINREKLQAAWEESRQQATSLETMNHRLLILDRLKSDFLSFISHELRTPLSALSALEMIEHASSPQDAKEMARIVKRGYERLENFIVKGLEYFRWLGSDCSDLLETCDLAEVVRHTVAELSREHAGQLACELDIGGPSHTRMASQDATEVVRVLLDNAVKFASGKPDVRVSLQCGSARVQLVVQDRGRGFPPEWASELFQPFTIVESMRHREGTALSLAMVAAMVQAHGGEIRAHSGGLGQGATFIVELPAEGAIPVDSPPARLAA
jgi:signal transduction histidine kinase